MIAECRAIRMKYYGKANEEENAGENGDGQNAQFGAEICGVFFIEAVIF